MEDTPEKALETPENQARIAKFIEQANAEDAKDAAAVKLFNPVALMKRASEIHEIDDPQLGLVKFGELVLADSELVDQCKTKKEKTAMTVYLMLKKAYPEMPEYTAETIEQFDRSFPMMEGSVLMDAIAKQPGFLLMKSRAGSATAKTATK